MVRCKSCNNYGRYIIEDAHNGPSNFTKPDTSEPLEEFEDELIEAFYLINQEKLSNLQEMIDELNKIPNNK